MENVQRRATQHVPDINNLGYQLRPEALNLNKITLGHFEDNCVKHLFEMKSTNTRVHQYPIKIRHLNTSIRRNHLAFHVVSVCDILSTDIVESVSLNVFKKKLDDHCLTRNIVFDPNYDFPNTYALSTLSTYALLLLFHSISSLIIFASSYTSS